MLRRYSWKTVPQNGTTRWPISPSGKAARIAPWIEIVNGLIRAGLKNIQVSSVVHPNAVPQLADTEEVMTRSRT